MNIDELKKAIECEEKNRPPLNQFTLYPIGRTKTGCPVISIPISRYEELKKYLMELDD